MFQFYLKHEKMKKLRQKISTSILTIMLLTSCQTHAKMTKVKIAKAPHSTMDQSQQVAQKKIETNEKLNSTSALQDLSYMTTEV
jgi:hypothetical protein